jgi:3'-5' exoribonuclease
MTMNENTGNVSEPTAPVDPPPGREHNTPPAQELRLEKVRKVYVRDLEEKERVQTVFLVTRKARNVGRTGKTFLVLVLADKTGDIDARIFDGIDQLEAQFAVGDYVLVQGEVITFHGKLQILISTLERLDPEPIDPKEFEPPHPTHDGKRVLGQIRETVAKVHDPHVKALLLAFLDDPQVIEGLQHPTAKAGPHGGSGALAERLVSMMKLANRLAEHYPMVDRDLLLAGALLHDIGKVRDLSDSSDEARLVGHPVMTAQAIHEKASQIPGFPRALEHHLAHLVLSHLGSPERGSPKPPMTLEALLLQSIVLMDTQVNAWLELMAKDPNERWTERSRLYDRQLWKGPTPTVRNKAPVDAKPRRRNGADRRRGSGPLPSAHESRHEAARDEPRREPSLPKEVTFKPLSEIAAEPPASPTLPPEEGQSSED